MKPLNLLLLDCSPRRDYSTSRHLTEQLLSALSAHFGREIHVMRRNRGTEPLPAITAEYAESLLLAAAEAKERHGAALAGSDALIRELEQADLLWISTPVHNFTVPAVLKNWIGLVVRRDVTFIATPEGKVGLLRDRPTFVAVTSGGAMFRDPSVQPDFFRPYLTAVLGTHRTQGRQVHACHLPGICGSAPIRHRSPGHAIAAQRRAVVTQASWQAFPRSHIPAPTSSTALRPDGCQTGNAVRSEPIWRGDAAFPNMESFHLPQHGEPS